MMLVLEVLAMKCRKTGAALRRRFFGVLAVTHDDDIKVIKIDDNIEETLARLYGPESAREMARDIKIGLAKAEREALEESLALDEAERNRKE